VRPYEVIHRKRDGRPVPPEAIAELVTRYAEGAVPDYQMAAFCMAVYFRGMPEPELQALTGAMLRSGDVLDLSDIPGPKVDKHSTGGVGDKTSLALAPLAAACGVVVPMVSGRGLGHTGGTLDKLESIPGFRIHLPVEEFREVLASVGACLIGQTERIAPADRKLYALRDLTATVESIPLIAASIMSKKLAEGIDGLVLDVKVGSGAFMKRLPQARELARTLVGIGRGMGKDVVALVTDMDQPLGVAVGNALEVKEILELLHGGGPADLRELTVQLGSEMLLLAGVVVTPGEGRARVEQAIADGRGFRKLLEIVEAQGGDPRALAEPDRLPRASRTVEVGAPAAGVVEAIDAEAVGLGAMALGAGRSRLEDRVDPAAGIEIRRRVGDPVAAGEPIATLHVGAAPLESPDAVSARLRAAWRIGAGPASPGPLVHERIEEEGR
jgi:pyrimidine-nucleoside phosphorylase/thymidine phosphorylase